MRHHQPFQRKPYPNRLNNQEFEGYLPAGDDEQVGDRMQRIFMIVSDDYLVLTESFLSNRK